MKIIVSNLIVPISVDQDKNILNELEKLNINKENILNIVWNKRSIDSRNRRNIKFIYSLEISLKEPINFNSNNISLCEDKVLPQRIAINKGEEVAIIGSGPAGLFAALRLCEYGYIPVIYEQGEMIDDRDLTTNDFINSKKLNLFSNIQFGEGGAGTYSDGKLNTRVKSNYIEKVFNEFVNCGADPHILWDYKPHIGTDILKVVIKNLRKKINSMGGRFVFNTKLIDFNTRFDRINEIKLSDNNGMIFTEKFNNVIFAIGNSARDTYKLLNNKMIAMKPKTFACGVRIEHLRSDIDMMQYGDNSLSEILGAATYSVTNNNKIENRGTFSFCMCPGGNVINATSLPSHNLVNGMSYSKRDGSFSNSAIVVAVRPDDVGSDLFACMRFQEELEKKAYELIGSYGALYQKVIDFQNNNITSDNILSSFNMNLYSFDFNKFFPSFISDNLQLAFDKWSKNKYFINKTTNIIGPETRTSAPVTILRNEFGESISIKGLYAIGEGSGYAGGITSSAIDGLKVVDLSFSKIL